MTCQDCCRWGRTIGESCCRPSSVEPGTTGFPGLAIAASVLAFVGVVVAAGVAGVAGVAVAAVAGAGAGAAFETKQAVSVEARKEGRQKEHGRADVVGQAPKGNLHWG